MSEESSFKKLVGLFVELPKTNEDAAKESSSRPVSISNQRPTFVQVSQDITPDSQELDKFVKHFNFSFYCGFRGGGYRYKET